ncbi:MAG: hypothetical protein A2Y57_00070 [Candidatus Woykebacteria bacterium RBG_13_40_7b]|uniref:Uncharacterized protein n=1 Tax=Candidatus Woykebacteria bacterium RBG_13_40_7b TaxID=1802594 RepID=A0A1G1W7M3_9BACT|nr:MAG: hypothetical protein A2Y57_00070 [Candidatus Woykebacteria bacterium RBG_13_40_7b]
MHRVETLAKRNPSFKPKERPPYKMLVPLLEILAEAMSSQVSSEKVKDEYLKLVNSLGSEIAILIKTPAEKIERITPHLKVAEGIERVRSGNIVIEPGFDGVFGKVKIWPESEKFKADQVSQGQIKLL